MSSAVRWISTPSPDRARNQVQVGATPLVCLVGHPDHMCTQLNARQARRILRRS